MAERAVGQRLKPVPLIEVTSGDYCVVNYLYTNNFLFFGT